MILAFPRSVQPRQIELFFDYPPERLLAAAAAGMLAIGNCTYDDQPIFWRAVRKVYELKYSVLNTHLRLYRNLFITRRYSSREIDQLIELIGDKAIQTSLPPSLPIVKNDLNRMIPIYEMLAVVAEAEPIKQLILVDLGCSFGFHSLIDRCAIHIDTQIGRRVQCPDERRASLIQLHGHTSSTISAPLFDSSRILYIGWDPTAPDIDNSNDIHWLEANLTFRNTHEHEIFQIALTNASTVNRAIIKQPLHELDRFVTKLPKRTVLVFLHSHLQQQLSLAERSRLALQFRSFSFDRRLYELAITPYTINTDQIVCRQYSDCCSHTMLYGSWMPRTNTISAVYC